ncbi:WD40 repeat-like protein [Basidiobolus meristosporus CBS 931.73]|uniref:WD40 repeat-like protein n=1 Tax=Basidiobolus meristosporus CBS 931.73 TaxID=1314790 RepID=A0A1Y1WZY9_9FUNG|nr:WD40 repeat-like protein [Basidiobolus meristosporus CBS 931.73]|eukprot:ORX79002.1 WD40 repeat-like protein [Basidiobolus meristosporus CBS 931.73]
MDHWGDEQKAEFAYQLLLSVNPQTVEGVISRLKPLLYKDFITHLPHELALHILSYTNIPTLGRVSSVCKKWHEVIDDSGLWRKMYFDEGWQVKELELNSAVQSEERNETTDPQQELLEELNSGIEEEDTESLVSPSEFEFSSTRVNAITRRIPELSLHDGLTQNASLSTIQNEQRLNFVGSAMDTPFNLNTRRIRRSTTLSGSSRSNQNSAAPVPVRDNPVLIYKDHVKTVNWRYLAQQRARLEYNWSHAGYQLRRLPGHAEGIYCIQFDSKKIISGSRDHTIKVWDIQSGYCISTYQGHTASVLCLQYDEEIIVSGSSDSTIIVWDIKTGEILRVLTGHTEPVLNLSFDKKHIVTCSKDRTIRIWDRASGTLLRTLTGHRIAVNAVQFKDGIIVSASGDRTIMMWDLETGACLKTLVGHTRGIACVQYDGKVIISGSKDKTIKIWDASSGECMKTLIGHTELVRTLQFNDTVILSGSYDRTIKLWDRKSGELLGDLRDGHTCRVFKAQFDSTKVVSCSQDHHVLIWDFAHNVDATYLA